jgi:hypothetical protein
MRRWPGRSTRRNADSSSAAGPAGRSVLVDGRPRITPRRCSTAAPAPRCSVDVDLKALAVTGARLAAFGSPTIHASYHDRHAVLRADFGPRCRLFDLGVSSLNSTRPPAVSRSAGDPGHALLRRRRDRRRAAAGATEEVQRLSTKYGEPRARHVAAAIVAAPAA